MGFGFRRVDRARCRGRRARAVARGAKDSRRLTLEALEPRIALSAAGLNPVGAQPDGNLSGKIFYINGGHGYAANNTGNGAWSYGRGLTNGIVEDLGNQDQMTFFADYLFRAGATVVPMRPVGNQPHEVVLDNDDNGPTGHVTFTGAWSDSSQSTFFGSAGDVPYRFADTSATETAVAKYTPNLSNAGFYPVYTWALSGSDRAADQLYRINYAGGSTEVTINHRAVGTGLVYLGTYYFEAGSGGSVEISNRSGEAGRVVIADAIRFGNGMGDISRGGGVSGRPREDELSLYWIMWQVDHAQGVSFDPTRSTLDSDSNVGVVPRYAAFMNREAEGSPSDRMLISFHTNAAGGRGVLGLYNGNNRTSAKTPHQFQLAKALGQEVNDDLVAQNGQYEFNWFNAGQNTTLDRSDIEFGEINFENIGAADGFDATIVEVAYHDNATDAALLRDPKVRDATARATYQGAVKFLSSIDGGATSLTMLPGRVTQVRAESVGPGSVKLSWTAPVANSYNGDAPAGYRIYGSTNGYGFDGGTFVAGGATTTFTVNGLAAAEGAYFFKVVAVNSGGEGAASEVVAAIPAGTTQKLLIVNGFDRLGRTQNPTQAVPGGQAERVRPRQSNSYDYAVQAAAAIEANTAAITVDTASNEMLISGALQLGDYDAVVWISGEESTADETFGAAEQALVTNYLAAGGKLFVTGAEIGWDLDAQGGGAAFYNGQLKADYVADDANTYNVNGPASGMFTGLSFAFDNGAQFYNSEYPDVIAATGGSVVNLLYSTGGVAGVQYANTGTGAQVVTFGFPFETITTAANRTAVMDRVLEYFGFALVVVPTGDFDDDGDVDGADFLLWQRGLGTMPNAAPGQGDSNLDGTVDAADLAVWSGQYGLSDAVAAAATPTSDDDARAATAGESDLSLIAMAQAFALLDSPQTPGLASDEVRVPGFAAKLCPGLPAAAAPAGRESWLRNAGVHSEPRSGRADQDRGVLAESALGSIDGLAIDRAFAGLASVWRGVG